MVSRQTIRGVRSLTKLSLVVAGLAVAVASGAEPEELEGKNLSLGYIDRDGVYVCALDGGNGAIDWVRLEKWDRSGQTLARYKIASISFRNTDTPLRWRIAHGCYWMMNQEANWSPLPALSVPLAHLRVYDPTNPERKDPEKRKLFSDLDFNHNWGLSPVNDIASGIHVSRMEGGFVSLQINEVCFDLLPTSTNSGLLFVLHNSHMRTYAGKARDPSPGSIGRVVLYEELGLFKVDFQEPFWVFGDRDTYVFVTRSGRVYLAKRGGKIHSTQLLWKEADRPVVAAIGDVPTSTTFLLAYAPRGLSKCLRLDKGGNMTQRVIDPGKLKPVRSDDTLGGCWPFAQYLISEGMISSPP
jgi:hypothetical protein